MTGRPVALPCGAERVADIRSMIAQQDRMAEGAEELTAALMAQCFG